MLARVLTGVVLIPIAVYLIFYPGGLPFAIAIGVVSILGAVEFYKGVRKVGARPVEWAGLLAVAMFVVSMRTYERSTIGSVFPAVLTLLLVLSFLNELLRGRRAPLVNVGATVFGAIYVGWLISHLVVLRGIGEHDDLRPLVVVGSFATTAGAWLVMYAFLCTWACDTGSYFIGKFYGKTKLAPRLSPNKTVEGSVAGLVSAVLVSVIVAAVIKLPQRDALALGVIFGVLSQLGDLSESAIKREIGVKDFGTIVPGHGGILDRFDSLLFTGPAVYYYAVLFLQGWPR
jgi:phosphatidate cytidylyltransferase